MKFLGAALAVFLATNCAMASETLVQPSPAQPHSTEQEAGRQKAEWEAALKRIRAIDELHLTPEQKCQARWNITWPLWKSGNLEARYNRLVSFEEGWVKLEGWPSDAMMVGRDNIILFMYSLGSLNRQKHFDYSTANGRRRYWDELVKMFPGIVQYTPVKPCILEKATQECAQIAARSGLIPTSEEYAAEIDEAIRGGAKIQCSAGDR